MMEDRLEKQSCKVLCQYHLPFGIYEGGSLLEPPPWVGGFQKSPDMVGLRNEYSLFLS